MHISTLLVVGRPVNHSPDPIHERYLNGTFTVRIIVQSFSWVVIGESDKRLTPAGCVRFVLRLGVIHDISVS